MVGTGIVPVMTYRDYPKTGPKRLKTDFKSVSYDDACVEDTSPYVEKNVRDQPFTAAIYETIGYIRSELLGTHSNLVDIDHRIFGNCTEASDEDERKEPYSVEAKIMTALRDLLIIAQDNRTLAQEVNARL